MYQVPNMIHMSNQDLRIIRRPFGFGFRPFGFGYGFPLGFLGGLAAGALIRPPYYPYYPPYPYYGGFYY
ncbi:hypothetical protein ABE096_17995 [Robertmurraya massiliosenegalensis]|uniref:hypothetical protein n=1 Tax=Robertmurraya TaxID=2837507 RepID=UPI0039A6D71C